MRALVPLLQHAGAKVSGCDLAVTKASKSLQQAGVPVALGHDSDHLGDVDIVIHSTAVPAQHPELMAAREAGLRTLTRPACLAALLTDRPTIAVAGSHGKTSTTWMLAHLLCEAQADPLVMLGGQVKNFAEHGGLAGSGWCVVEVDESDGAFQYVEPQHAIITNLEAEHQRHYGDFAGLCRAFATWLEQLPADGRVIVPDQGLDQRLLAAAGDRVLAVGIEDGEVRAQNVSLQASGTEAEVYVQDQHLGTIWLPTPGRHMLHNALMAIAAARLIAPQVDISSLQRYQRVARRFIEHQAVAGVVLIEDYAHHPTEISATLAAAKLAGQPMHVVVQPHRYSRLADYFTDFVQCFDLAESLCVLPVYAAGEHIGDGPDSTDLVAAVMTRWHQQRGAVASGKVQAAPRAADAQAFSVALAQPGSRILLLGAGDIGGMTKQWKQALMQRSVEES